MKIGIRFFISEISFGSIAISQKNIFHSTAKQNTKISLVNSTIQKIQNIQIKVEIKNELKRGDIDYLPGTMPVVLQLTTQIGVMRLFMSWPHTTYQLGFLGSSEPVSNSSREGLV